MKKPDCISLSRSNQYEFSAHHPDWRAVRSRRSNRSRVRLAYLPRSRSQALPCLHSSLRLWHRLQVRCLQAELRLDALLRLLAARVGLSAHADRECLTERCSRASGCRPAECCVSSRGDEGPTVRPRRPGLQGALVAVAPIPHLAGGVQHETGRTRRPVCHLPGTAREDPATRGPRPPLLPGAYRLWQVQPGPAVLYLQRPGRGYGKARCAAAELHGEVEGASWR